METGIIKGLETNSDPNNRKNSPGCLGFAPRSQSFAIIPAV